MKIIGKFQILDETSSDLTLDPELARALALSENGAILYGSALVYGEKPLDHNRKMTLVASPFPENSWRKLVRVAISPEPLPGSLFRTINALSSLDLYCRFIEEVPSSSLHEVSLHVSGQPVLGTPTGAPEGLLASVLVILELPLESSLPLHDELKKLFEGSGRDASTAIGMLTLELRAKLEISGASTPERRSASNLTQVNWISPMSTLFRLGEREKPRADRLRLKKADDNGGMSVSLLPWRRFLWAKEGYKELPHLGGPKKGEKKVLVMSTVDSDERVICWHFYEYSEIVVVEFDMTVPAFGLEQIWWEYVYDCVQRADGWILSSYSSSRFESCWSTLRTAALFPLNRTGRHREVGEDDAAMRRIVNCFRDLQGDISYTRHFVKLQEKLKKAREELGPKLLPTTNGYVAKWQLRNTTDRSRLERLVVWDPHSNGAGRRHSPELFAVNPFNFTNPLERDGFKALYEDQPEDLHSGRRRIAERVVDRFKLGPGENFAVVGAHRTGKTTVLNLVYDFLEKEWTANRALLPVRINASVTPPHMIFLEVVANLQAVAKEFALDKRTLQVLHRATTRMRSFAENLIRASTVKLPILEIKGEVLLQDNLRSLLAQVESERKEALPEFLRMALGELQRALAATGETRLVVIVDELSDLSLWGDPRSFAVWRHAIESGEFKSLSWLISTSRPIEETTKYSPITNVLRELNVGSLDDTEAKILINAFSATGWREDASQGEEAGDGDLRPVITQPARSLLVDVTSKLPYLLQVACFHLYDRATRGELPLINKQLCRKVLLTKVLPELSDYFEHQWAQISLEAQRFVKDSLNEPSLPKACRDPDIFLRSLEKWTVKEESMPPGSRKGLERSGLRGDEGGYCVAPLVAAWILAAGVE